MWRISRRKGVGVEAWVCLTFPMTSWWQHGIW